VSSSAGNPSPPTDESRKLKQRAPGLFRRKKSDEVPREEEHKEAAKRFQEFFEKA